MDTGKFQGTRSDESSKEYTNKWKIYHVQLSQIYDDILIVQFIIITLIGIYFVHFNQYWITFVLWIIVSIRMYDNVYIPDV